MEREESPCPTECYVFLLSSRQEVGKIAVRTSTSIVETIRVIMCDPEWKDGLVEGRYEVDAPAGKTTVAVKVTDMLGVML